MDPVREFDSIGESGNYDFIGIETENGAEKVFGMDDKLMVGPAEQTAVKTESNDEKVAGDDDVVRMDIKEEGFVNDGGYECKLQDEDTISEIYSPKISGINNFYGVKEENGEGSVLWTKEVNMECLVESLAVKTESSTIVKYENGSEAVPEDEDIPRMNVEEESMLVNTGVSIHVEDVSCFKVEDVDITIDYVKQEGTEGTEGFGKVNMNAVRKVEEESGNCVSHEIKIENDADKVFGMEGKHMEGTAEPAAVGTESSVISEYGNIDVKVVGDEDVVRLDIKEEVTDDWGYEYQMQDEDTVPEMDGQKISGIYYFCGVKVEHGKEKLLETEDVHMEDLVELREIKTQSGTIIKYENSSEEVPEDEGITRMNIEKESMMEERGVSIQGEDVSCMKVGDNDISIEYVKQEETGGIQDTQLHRFGGNDISTSKASSDTCTNPKGITSLICEKPFMCDVCDYRSAVARSLKRHMRIHTGEKPFACDVCDYRSISAGNLKRHMRIHTGEKLFACDVCDYRSSRAGNLKTHMRIHTEEKPFACDVCDYRCTSAGNLKSHMRIHTGEKLFACDICDYRCSQAANLKTHVRVHTGEKPFACDVCDDRFSRAGSLKTHMRLHTGEKPFACDVCDYRCIRAVQLKAHMRVHTGEKPFACDVCDYRFSRAGKLKDHMRVHTGEKPFACDVCDYRFSRAETLKKHMRVHTVEKSFACDVCDYRSADAGHLKRHIVVHEGETVFACYLCNYRCRRRIQLKRHICRTHSSEKSSCP